MANKIYNGILEKLLMKCKHYRNIDLMFALVDLSIQVKDKEGSYKFIVPCYRDSAHGIWNEVNLKYPNLINKTTVNDCVKELKELNIIKYNETENGFEIIDMGKMLDKRDKGYTTLRNFFFTDEFVKMPYVEKKVFIYMIHLMDKKGVAHVFKQDYGVDIICNLNNYRSNYNKEEMNWMTICNTENIYYVKRILDSLATNYSDILKSKTNKNRIEKYGKEKGIARGVCVDVIYFFNLKKCIKENTYNEEKELDSLIKKYPDLNDTILCAEKRNNIEFTIQQKIALLRRLFNLLPFAQNSIIEKVISRIKYSIEINTKNHIRNIEAFVQYLLNKSPKLKYARIDKKEKYSRGVTDNILVEKLF